jgi:hypothetical protein
MTKKRGLGDDLRVQKRRCGLKGYRQELVQPMEPARRMDIAQRDGEDQASRQQAGQAPPVSPPPLRPAADHMVTLIDRFQKGPEMLLRPALFRRGHEHQRQRGPLQAAFQCTTEAIRSHRHDRALDGSPRCRDQVGQ